MLRTLLYVVHLSVRIAPGVTVVALARSVSCSRLHPPRLWASLFARHARFLPARRPSCRGCGRCGCLGGVAAVACVTAVLISPLGRALRQPACRTLLSCTIHAAAACAVTCMTGLHDNKHNACASEFASVPCRLLRRIPKPACARARARVTPPHTGVSCRRVSAGRGRRQSLLQRICVSARALLWRLVERLEQECVQPAVAVKYGRVRPARGASSKA
jgi:hypothetical protein